MNMIRKKNRMGFTLVELLVAVAIMAILMALVVGLSGVARRKSTEAKAQAEIQSIATALEEYRMIAGTYPKELSLLTNSSSKINQQLKDAVVTTDPWARPYVYTNITKYSYTLYSNGARTDIADDNITAGSVQ